MWKYNYPVTAIYVVNTDVNNLEQRSDAVHQFYCVVILYKSILEPYGWTAMKIKRNSCMNRYWLHENTTSR